MNSNYILDEFYPTPVNLLDKICEGVKYYEIRSVLEPSAGKGDIAEYIMSKVQKLCDVDCIEKNELLQATLKGKGLRVIHDDFLTFDTFKRYDLIIMNPPFSEGAKHLLKAIEMQKNGGNIICILNAETIRNPYSNERKDLVRKLNEMNASIEFLQEEFASAERKTLVEIAVIKVAIAQEKLDSEIYKNLKKKNYAEFVGDYENTSVADSDIFKALVLNYNLEVEAGVKFIKEYQGLKQYTSEVSGVGQYKSTVPVFNLSLSADCHGYNHDEVTINRFIELTRMKYWRALFSNPKFTGKMTSEQLKKYQESVEDLKNYDFSMFNILQIHKEMSSKLISGIEDCIIKLFDELSFQHSYYDTSQNIHYFNGWKSNTAWKVNEKVVTTINAYNNYFDNDFAPDYRTREKIKDIEKALAYLDGGLTDGKSVDDVLNEAKANGQTKNIEFKFFYATFFKKGTCHIKFKDKELLKKFNIFGAQYKNWLPHDFGKKAYADMDSESKAVVDSFEGSKEYEKTLANADYFIYSPANAMLRIEAA